nr:MgtC/SapB family protein [Goodfellowiella coeruleoviolacea]
MFGQTTGQGWTQLALLTLALVLSSLIGLERELRQKNAGLRTHTLVGLGSALFLMVSKYGFGDVLQAGLVNLDPSRMAAQIVSGIGFIGGGLIFVRRDVVRGLTTAAVVWVTAAVGCACGAGLPLLALFVTLAHFAVVYGYPPLIRLLTRSQSTSVLLRLHYVDGQGVLRQVLSTVTSQGFSVAESSTERRSPLDDGQAFAGQQDFPGQGFTGQSGAVSTLRHAVDLRLRVVGVTRVGVDNLLVALSELPGVLSVVTGDMDDSGE